MEVQAPGFRYYHKLAKLDKLKQEKRNIKRQIQLADVIIKEDLYRVNYAVSENEEIVADRELEILGMEEDTEDEKAEVSVVGLEKNVAVMNSVDSQNDVTY